MNEILIIIITVVFITSPAIVKSRFSVLSDFSRYITPDKMPKAEGMRAKRSLNITDIMLTIPQSKEITAKYFICVLFLSSVNYNNLVCNFVRCFQDCAFARLL